MNNVCHHVDGGLIKPAALPWLSVVQEGVRYASTDQVTPVAEETSTATDGVQELAEQPRTRQYGTYSTVPEMRAAAFTPTKELNTFSQMIALHKLIDLEIWRRTQVTARAQVPPADVGPD